MRDSSKRTIDRAPILKDEGLRGSGASSSMRRGTIALAEALFATHLGPPPAARLEWLADELDDFLAHSGTRARAVYVSCLVVISWTAPLLIGARPPFPRLSLADRARCLEALEASPLGMAVLGAKAILCILYYEHPEVADEIGYDGTCQRGPNSPPGDR